MREPIQNTNGKQFHAVSLSGGKDSTAMLLLMIERDMPCLLYTSHHRHFIIKQLRIERF